MRADFRSPAFTPLGEPIGAGGVQDYRIGRQQRQRQLEVAGDEFQSLERRDVRDAGRDARIAAAPQAVFLHVEANRHLHAGAGGAHDDLRGSRATFMLANRRLSSAVWKACR